MKRLEQLAAALTPKRWPVRWRLAAVSAVLTFLILVIFALVVGRLTSNRLQTDFNDELRDASTQLATQLHVQSMDSSQLRQTLADAAGIRVIRVNGDTLGAGQSNLGPPPSTIPGFTNVGSLRVYTERTQDQFGFPEILQYARSTDNVSAKSMNSTAAIEVALVSSVAPDRAPNAAWLLLPPNALAMSPPRPCCRRMTIESTRHTST